MTLNPQVLVDTKIYCDSADLTGYSNKVMLAPTADALDATTFGSGGWKARVGGLFDTTASLEGFWQAGDLTQPDDLFWANLSDSQAALTFCPTAGTTVGDLCYLTRAMETKYDPSGQIGQLFAFAVDWSGNWPVARGQILNPTGVVRSSSGNGTGRQLGAVAAGQRMYANLHVLAASGTSVAVKLQSSVDNTFASPTDRITFTTATALGGQSASLVGPVTDTWWRAVWTVVSGSFTFVCSAGIASK